MKAYWFDNLPGDQRLPHQTPRSITASELEALGVSYHHCPSLAQVNSLASERGYLNRDEVTISPTAMGGQDAYEAKLRIFFSEHLHEDEEIRYILDGRGFFDVRGQADEWLRIELEKDDLIVLPAGIYHRFTTDEGDYIKAMRLFKSDPKWTPLNRNQEIDKNPFRQEYLRSRSAQSV